MLGEYCRTYSTYIYMCMLLGVLWHVDLPHSRLTLSQAPNLEWHIQCTCRSFGRQIYQICFMLTTTLDWSCQKKDTMVNCSNIK